MLSMQGVDTDSTLARRLYTVPHTKMMIQNTILCAVAKLERRRGVPGLKKPAGFSEIRRKPMESGRSEFQNHEFTVHCFKILKEDKSQQKNM
jgi:hypothetical protein